MNYNQYQNYPQNKLGYKILIGISFKIIPDLKVLQRKLDWVTIVIACFGKKSHRQFAAPVRVRASLGGGNIFPFCFKYNWGWQTK